MVDRATRDCLERQKESVAEITMFKAIAQEVMHVHMSMALIA